MLVLAGHGVTLVVDAGGEARVAVGATPAVDAGALEELGAHLEEVVGHGPAHRAQARAHLQREARKLHRVAGHVALVVASSVVEELARLGVGFPLLVEELGNAPAVLGGDLVREGRHLLGAVEPFGLGRGLGRGHVGLDRVDEGAEGVHGDGLVERLVVLIPHEAVVVGPQLLLLLEHAVEQLVGTGTVGDGRGGHAQQRIHRVVLRLHARILVPGHAVTVGVRLGLDREPHAAVDGVGEVVGERLDGMIGVAARAGQTHESAKREHVGHATCDGQVDRSSRVGLPIGVEMRETSRDDRAFCLFNEGLHVATQPTVMFDGIKPSHDVPPDNTVTVFGDRHLIG